MAESMYKGVLGWSMQDEKHPGTYMLLTNDEYLQLLNKINTAKQEKATTESVSKENIRKVEISSDEAIKKVEEEAQERIDEITEKLHLVEQEVLFQKNLNANLLRISKERANADRKLKPKKEHTGYVVISSQEKEIRYRNKKQMLSAVVWETVLQSPYNIEFTEDQARKQIFDELLTNDGGWKLGDIGITNRFITTYENLVANNRKEIKSVNIAFNQRLRANYKVGYWEYIVLHTLPLGPVPKDMLP